MIELCNSQLSNIGQINKFSQLLETTEPTFVVTVKVKCDTMYTYILPAPSKHSFYASFHQHPDDHHYHQYISIITMK